MPTGFSAFPSPAKKNAPARKYFATHLKKPVYEKNQSAAAAPIPAEPGK